MSKMNKDKVDLILKIADYYIKNKSTIRETARYFGLSKSTVYHYIKTYLPKLDNMRYLDCKCQITVNKRERSNRGGMATKRKYKKGIS